MAGAVFFGTLSSSFLFTANAAAEDKRPGASPGGQDKAQQAADLLQRARQAMAENNMSTAESLIAQSEALGVEYNAFHMGDTPKKARKDLERKRNSAAALKPSPVFSPAGGNKKNVPAADPFAGRVADPPSNPVRADAGYATAGQSPGDPRIPSPQNNSAPSGEIGNELAALGRGHSDPSAAGMAVASSGNAGPAANPNDNPLRTARKMIALGDLRRANDLVQQAKLQNAQYGPQDDNPRKVEDSLRRMYELSQLDKNTDAYRRGYSRILMEQGDAMMRYGDFDEAERLANLAASQQVVYGPYEPKPLDLMNKISTARRSGGNSGVVPAANFEVVSAGGVQDNRMANQAIYDPQRDATRNVQVQNTAPTLAPPRTLDSRDGALMPPAEGPSVAEGDGSTGGTQGQSLFQQGEAALKAHDKDRAYQLFRQASARMNELDAATAQRLQGYMQMLGTAQSSPNGGAPANPLDDATARQQALARQVASELAHLEANARAQLASNPQAAMEQLEEAKKKIENAGLEPQMRDMMLRRLDRAVAESKQFIDENRPQLERAAKNDRIRKEVERKQMMKSEDQEKIAQFVDDFNRQIDECRYEEAQVTAKRAYELYPKEPIVNQIYLMAKLQYRYNNSKNLTEEKQNAFYKEMGNVNESAIAHDSNNVYDFPEIKKWKEISGRKSGKDYEKRNMTEREFEIQKKLQTPVLVSFKDAPLSRVVETLAKYADVNIVLDPKGLNEEGQTSDTPVTLEIKHEIMLKSALNLILEPLHLSYVVKDEVLKITSEQLRDGQIFPVTYNVADLVIPIPNFVPIPMGMDAAYRNALDAVGWGGGAGFSPSNSPLAVVADNNGKGGRGLVNPKLMAQIAGSSGLGGGNRMPGGSPGPIGFGPGGLGGGTQADFDPLLDLITKTIKPTSWDDVGGPGSIQPFETNLSIVVSQTQEVHDEIAELLGQLRRMQDLQVTIEVRFITLNDNFFERIGIDFDFNIHDWNWGRTSAGFGSADNAAGQTAGAQTEPLRNTVLSTRDKNATVGMSGPLTSSDVPNATQFTSTLDIPFRQGSYALAIPQFGGFDPSAGASMGFAILSDIEAYFFINAAQGDKRSNVLQAPKVTLFNGQQAVVSDMSQTPFVTSVIPVVGDFAAAQQPVIMVLSEGTFMTVQAVVSQDRRFVRLTVVPFFSKIGDVKTFTFTGSDTTTTDTSTVGNQTTPTDATQKANRSSTTHSGTTVQLPTFSYVTVTTTVSVPDGGTVLLGGIKRLSEGRSEFGVPMLAELPYINRLFKNTAVGRETQSLMMMVTPRIIIQEEEENKLGIKSGS